MPVTRFERTPAVVETVEWTGRNAKEVCGFVGRIPGGHLPAFQPATRPGGAGRLWNPEQRCWDDVPEGHHIARRSIGGHALISPAELAADYIAVDEPEAAAS